MPPAAGRVEEVEESFLGRDEPYVGIDEVLSVGRASSLSMPQGPLGLGELLRAASRSTM